MSIAEKFLALLDNLRVENLDELAARFRAITKQINTDFRNYPSDEDYSKFVGPIGRGTAIKTTKDIEMVVRLPGSLYGKYNSLSVNGPLSMLRDVKSSMAKAFPQQGLHLAEKAVVIPFADMTFWVTPVVQLGNGDYVAPDSNDGTWRRTLQLEEVEAINQANRMHKRKVKDLARMAHAWRQEWQVPLSHMLLDTLVVEFLNSDAYEDSQPFDRLIRDFLRFLAAQDPTQESWQALGSGVVVARDGDFETKAREAYVRASRAVELGEAGDEAAAGAVWKTLFGAYFPD